MAREDVKRYLAVKERCDGYGPTRGRNQEQVVMVVDVGVEDTWTSLTAGLI